MRKSVYQKLKDAQNLLPNDLRFCLHEGFRSLSLQKTIFIMSRCGWHPAITNPKGMFIWMPAEAQHDNANVLILGSSYIPKFLKGFTSKTT